MRTFLNFLLTAGLVLFSGAVVGMIVAAAFVPFDNKLQKKAHSATLHNFRLFYGVFSVIVGLSAAYLLYHCLFYKLALSWDLVNSAVSRAFLCAFLGYVAAVIVTLAVSAVLKAVSGWFSSHFEMKKPLKSQVDTMEMCMISFVCMALIMAYLFVYD